MRAAIVARTSGGQITVATRGEIIAPNKIIAVNNFPVRQAEALL
jgi:hypothetical protein